MADSIREKIVTDVVTLLNTNRPADVPIAKRSYGLGLPPVDIPALAVYRKSDKFQRVGGPKGPIRKRHVVIHVECWAKSDPADPANTPDDKVDTLVKWVVKALEGQSKGVSDGQLYHVLEVEESEIEYSQSDYLYVHETVVVIAEYQSKSGDLETWA